MKYINDKEKEIFELKMIKLEGINTQKSNENFHSILSLKKSSKKKIFIKYSSKF